MAVRAAGDGNGDLRVRVAGRDITVVPGLCNLPLSIAILRCSHGTTYFAGGPDEARGLAAHPWVQPVAVDKSCEISQGYLGAHQSVIGEVGFTNDTRIYGVAFDTWPRSCPCQMPLLTDDVSVPDPGVVGPEPAGCIAGVIPAEPTWLRFRDDGAGTYWEVRLGDRRIELVHFVAGAVQLLRSCTRPRRAAHLMIKDDGDAILVAVDGRQILGSPVPAGGAADGALITGGTGWDTHELTTVPRRIKLPESLILGDMWSPGDQAPVVADDLVGHGSLAGHESDGLLWRRVEGQGNVLLTDAGALVDASPDRPHPGRTLHVVHWAGDTVDLEITITPPGGDVQTGHRGRAGVVFRDRWGNQLIVATYLDEWYVGRSLSSFVTIGGKEHFYRAVWTNVGDRIAWGTPYRLRVAFDGDQYLAWIDDEPVLYRRVSDVVPDATTFKPEQVGLAVNEEFGNDTGSTFSHLAMGLVGNV